MPAAACGRGERLHVLHHVLRLVACAGRAGISEGAAFRDHVVLQVLDDEGAAGGIEFEEP